MRARWLVGVVLLVLLVPALALTLARMLEPDGGMWVRLVAFTPYAVGLYALALLILLIRVAVTRGARRGISGFLAAVALAGLVLHLLWAAGPYVGHPNASASTGRPFTVMTSNLKIGGADTTRVVEVAMKRDVDILVLEEVTPRALSRLSAAGLKVAFPFSAGKAASGPAGTMVFSSFRLRGVHRLETGFGSYAMTVRLPGGAIDLLAVHPEPPIGDAVAWRTDHRTIRQAARAATRPTLVVGDLNATPDHEPMRELAGRGFADAATRAKSGWQPTWPAAGEVSVLGVPVPSLLQLDHVLLDDDLSALHTESVTIPGTDHRALVARLVRP